MRRTIDDRGAVLNGWETGPDGRCRRCAGTGQFITRSENRLDGRGFVPRGPGGVCFRCDGKGWQNEADEKRNSYYDQHRPVSIGGGA
jgi:hypothetical protein